MSGKKKRIPIGNTVQQQQQQPSPPYDNDDNNESMSNDSNMRRSETSKLRCFMGCTVTLFLLTFLFVLMNFGFVISIWMNTKHDNHHHQQHGEDVPM